MCFSGTLCVDRNTHLKYTLFFVDKPKITFHRRCRNRHTSCKGFSTLSQNEIPFASTACLNPETAGPPFFPFVLERRLNPYTFSTANDPFGRLRWDCPTKAQQLFSQNSLNLLLVGYFWPSPPSNLARCALMNNAEGTLLALLRATTDLFVSVSFEVRIMGLKNILVL